MARTPDLRFVGRYPIPSHVRSDTVPSTLDLLRAPYAFSQTHLLSERDFERQAKERGIRADSDVLEQLHRRRLLDPFYRVLIKPTEIGEDRTPATGVPHSSTAVMELYSASSEGRLRDPAKHAFRRWPRRWSPIRHLYSHHQLLALYYLEPFADAMRLVRLAGSSDVQCELGIVPPRTQDSFAHLRALAIALEVLSPRYLPRVLRVLRSPSDDLHEHVEDRQPDAEHELLGLDAATAVAQAEQLLAQAKFFDPLGKWHRVIRIGSSRKWDDLRGSARMAIDHRIAAEMLLLYAEDLARAGKGQPLESLSTVYWSPRHDRLSVNSRERAEALLDFALTDSPALVLALEGKSDVALMRNTLELLGVATESGTLEFVDMKGVGGDVRLLARSRGIPRIDPEGYVGARVLRPLTAIMVAVDPEGAYATPAGCEEQRQAMIEEILESLPHAIRTEVLRQDLGHLIHVTTWGEASLEYAHFTDSELAGAIRDMAGGLCPLAQADLEAAIAFHRANHSNIEHLWAKWRIPELSKPNLATHLWPALRRKIEMQHRNGRSELPILRVANEAIDKVIAVQGVRELRTKSE